MPQTRPQNVDFVQNGGVSKFLPGYTKKKS